MSEVPQGNPSPEQMDEASYSTKYTDDGKKWWSLDSINWYPFTEVYHPQGNQDGHLADTEGVKALKADNRCDVCAGTGKIWSDRHTYIMNEPRDFPCPTCGGTES